MTRREEIEHAWFERALRSNYQYDERSFKEGIEWADKTMIDKACKWMKEQVYQEYGGGPLERLIPDTRIADFRKAMEE